MPASIKIMLSYDYCHFEIAKSTDENLSDDAIDTMRKDVQRLAIKAVDQYKIFKRHEEQRANRRDEKESLERQLKRIMEKPEGERTINEIAIIKTFKDKNWQAYIESKYDFDDDYNYEQYEGDR